MTDYTQDDLDAVAQKFRRAAPFLDMCQGETLEDVYSLASEIEERLIAAEGDGAELDRLEWEQDSPTLDRGGFAPYHETVTPSYQELTHGSAQHGAPSTDDKWRAFHAAAREAE